MLAKFTAKIALLFALAGVSLNALANMLSGRDFALSIPCWSLAISIFVVGFGFTSAALCFSALRERLKPRWPR